MKTKEEVIAWIREHNFEEEFVKRANPYSYAITPYLLLECCCWPIENYDLWKRTNCEFKEWFGDLDTINIVNNKLV